MKQQLQQIQTPNLNEEWPELQAIDVIKAEPYPIDALPDGIREAVEEVVDYVQCPVAQAACSAIAAISIAAQGIVDVYRDNILHGPINLYMLIVGKSGERKTTGDNYFTKGIRDWENNKAEEYRPIMKKYEAEVNGWKAEKEGILSALKQASKNNDSAQILQEKARLVEHEKHEPKPLRIPRLLYDDATPEALASSLHDGWHSAGILSNEAGSVFGSHGMNKDSITRNLSLYNKLWENGTIKFDRRGIPSFQTNGVRFTMCLAVQPDIIQNFFNSNEGLVRSIGFTSRFLFASPQSTQGTRLYRNPPTKMTNLDAFNGRIQELLNYELNMDSDTGAIDPEKLELDSEAKELWVNFHNDIEVELKDGGELESISDIASKIADNAARMAATLHTYCYHELGGPINKNSMERACALVHWHLLEAKRFFTEISIPIKIKNALKLDKWLIKYCVENNTQKVSTRDAKRLGPYTIQQMKQAELEAIYEILIERGRIKIIESGKQKHILVNPILLETARKNSNA